MPAEGGPTMSAVRRHTRSVTPSQSGLASTSTTTSRHRMHALGRGNLRTWQNAGLRIETVNIGSRSASYLQKIGSIGVIQWQRIVFGPGR